LHHCAAGASRGGLALRTGCKAQGMGYSKDRCSNVKVAVAVYSKQIKLCTQKSLQARKSRLAKPCHPLSVPYSCEQCQSRPALFVLPLHRVQHSFFLQKKPLNSEAHEHEGGRGQGASRRPCEKKHPIHSFPPSEIHAAKQTKDERVLEPGAQRCHPRRFKEKRSV
jgi:hypothetical protein